MKKLSTIVRAAVVGACASLALGACAAPDRTGQSGSADNSDVTIGLTYIPNIQFAPVYVADAQGTYNDAGISTTILGDLAGKTVGIPGEHGANYYATRAALQEAGLAESNVTISPIGYTQQAALASGQVDAVVGFTNNDSVQMRLAGLDIREISLDPSSTPLVSASIITTHKWAQEHPEQARAVVSATTQAMNAIAADPQIAIDATKPWDTSLTDEATLTSARAVLTATVPLWIGESGHATGTQDEATWARMISFLESLGELQGRVDPSSVVTNDYVVADADSSSRS